MVPAEMNSWAALGLLALVAFWSFRELLAWRSRQAASAADAATDAYGREAAELSGLRGEVDRLRDARRSDERRHAQEQQAMANSMAALAAELAEARAEVAGLRAELAALKGRLEQ